MAGQWIMGFILLTLPLLAGVGLFLFMATGKGKSNTTDEILAHRHEKMKKRDELSEDELNTQKA